MLPKKQKIKLNKDFDKVFKIGRSIYGQFLGVKAVGNNLNHSRFGVIISKKIEKSAVKRHFLKRYIYRAIKKNMNQVSFCSDCVIIALSDLKKASSLEIDKDLQNIFYKIFK